MMQWLESAVQQVMPFASFRTADIPLDSTAYDRHHRIGHAYSHAHGPTGRRAWKQNRPAPHLRDNTTDCTWAMLGRAMNAVPCRRTTWPSADSEGNHHAGRPRMLTPDDANGVLNHAVKDTVTAQSTF